MRATQLIPAQTEKLNLRLCLLCRAKGTWVARVCGPWQRGAL